MVYDLDWIIGEILLNHLMFADDICVFCPSVRGLQSIPDVCQAYAELHGIIFNCRKTICIRAQKAQSSRCWHWVDKVQNLLSTTNIWGLDWILSSRMTKTLSALSVSSDRQFRYQYCAANNLRASFSRCSYAVKHVLFSSFCTSMYASTLWCNFRKTCMQRLRVTFYFGCRALYNLPWRASASCHQVQCNIPTFEALLRKMCTCFLKDAQSLTTHGCAVWCSQVVYIRPYSLNTTTSFTSWLWLSARIL